MDGAASLAGAMDFLLTQERHRCLLQPRTLLLKHALTGYRIQLPIVSNLDSQQLSKSSLVALEYGDPFRGHQLAHKRLEQPVKQRTWGEGRKPNLWICSQLNGVSDP